MAEERTRVRVGRMDRVESADRNRVGNGGDWTIGGGQKSSG